MENALSVSPSRTATQPIAPDWQARATVVARGISDLFSPAVMAVPCLLLGVWVSDVVGTIWYALLYFAIAIPLPVAYVVWLVKSGRVTDFHLPNRRDRAVPFLLSILCTVAAAVLLVVFGAPTSFVAPVATALAQTLVLFLITLAWQISIHTSVTAGLVTFAILALGSGGFVLAPLVPLVAWARLHLGRHTVGQTVAGALLGVASFCLMFVVRGLLW